MAAKPVTGIALITGGGAGIGRETAHGFAEAGVAGIALADINEDGANETAVKCKEFAKNPDFRVMVVKVDVRDASSVQHMVDTTIKEFGRIDYLLNSAGHGHDSSLPISDLDVQEWNNTLAVNITGTMLCMRAVSKVMQTQEPLASTNRHGSERSLGRGCIVNMGSANSFVAVPGTMPYVASKFAIIGMTKTAALDLAAHGIRVNAVCPSWVDGQMMQNDFDRSPGLREYIESAVPIGRMASFDEVSDYIVFLCSPSATYINGTGLLIDAGATLSLHLSQ